MCFIIWTALFTCHCDGKYIVLSGALYAACDGAQVQLRRYIAAKSLFSSHFSDIISIQSIRNSFKPQQETLCLKIR